MKTLFNLTPLRLILSIIAALLFLAVISNYVANFTGLSFTGIFAVIFLFCSIPNKNAMGALFVNGINIANLTAALGAYYQEHRNILISETLLGFDPSDSFEVWDNVSDEEPMPNLSITDLIQPGNDATFNPTANALSFGARKLKVRNWKVDLLIQPRTLEKTWLGAYKKPGSSTNNMIFEEFIFAYIIKKIQQNLRLQSVFRGVYNAAGTTPIDVMDGLLTLVTASIANGDIPTPVVTGAITQPNVTAKLLLVHDALGEAYKAEATEMPVNPTIFDWYTRQFATVLNPQLVSTQSGPSAAQPLFNTFPLSGTNSMLKREPGLGTSQRIICTAKENKVYGTDSLSDENNFEIQKFERSIKILIDAKSGVNFKETSSNALAVNDQV
jgi:hypothetical protein